LRVFEGYSAAAAFKAKDEHTVSRS
jgi:hypothetical protein